MDNLEWGYLVKVENKLAPGQIGTKKTRITQELQI